MKLIHSGPFVLLSTLFVLLSSVLAEDLIRSTALLSCMENSQFTASNFDVIFFPSNHSVNFEVSAISTLSGKFRAHVQVIAYGFTIIEKTLNLCDISSQQLCPMTPGHFDVPLSSETLGNDVVGQVPGIAFKIPDLDGIVRVTVMGMNDNVPVACVEATLSNGKTVSTKYASWPIAAICFAGLLCASVVWLFGHVSTSAHIASNIVSLFCYFQGVAIICMMGVDRLPPVAAAWGQNFVWTLGLISLQFMQNIFNWYVQATGGTTTNILPNAQVMSISVQKIKRDLSESFSDILAKSFTPNRHVDRVANHFATTRFFEAATEYAPALIRRAGNSTMGPAVTTDETLDDFSATTLVLRGIQRMAFLANIEITSLFLTGFAFFLFLCVVTLIIFSVAKGMLELFSKTGTIQQMSFLNYRNAWTTVLKGILYRIVLLCFPQLTVLCLWEFTKHDSPAVVVLAVITYVIVAALLGFGAYKTISLARRSKQLHKNPAYILYSDSEALNRWGFLYVQFRATAYYFVIPLLGYTFIKCALIAFGQSAGKAVSVIIFVLELGYLILISYYKPYMDKSTNGFNIGISAINFINALFFMFFSSVFGLPPYVAGVMGVVFFILNAVFSLVLLIMVLVSCIWAMFAKNPETRYEPMRDDRDYFIPNSGSEKKAITELNALGASARDGHTHISTYEIDTESMYSKPRDPDFPSARLSRSGRDLGFGEANSSTQRLNSDLNSSTTTLQPNSMYSGYHQNSSQTWHPKQ